MAQRHAHNRRVRAYTTGSARARADLEIAAVKRPEGAEKIIGEPLQIDSRQHSESKFSNDQIHSKGAFLFE